MKREDARSVAYEAGQYIRKHMDGIHDVAVILGTGLSGISDRLGSVTHADATEKIPGFLKPVAGSHRGTVSSLQCNMRRVLAFSGRTHLYEGHGPFQATHAVRTAREAGCSAIVLTSAVGMLVKDRWSISTPFVVADHIDSFHESPCIEGYPNLSQLYSKRFQGWIHEEWPETPAGVLAQIRGPQLETDAEVRMMRAWGADLVGMSVAIEAIVAREVGMEVGAISIGTDYCGPEAQHVDIAKAAEAASPHLSLILRHTLSRF